MVEVAGKAQLATVAWAERRRVAAAEYPEKSATVGTAEDIADGEKAKN